MISECPFCFDSTNIVLPPIILNLNLISLDFIVTPVGVTYSHKRVLPSADLVKVEVAAKGQSSM